MKGFLIAMVLMASAFFIPVNLSCQEKEILCCRPVCECNPENLMCDFKNIEECRTLGGWEVEDCTECASRKRE